MDTISVQTAERDLYPQIKAFLGQSDAIYPGIEHWWQRRVVPGINNEQRVCRVAVEQNTNRVVAIAIGKHCQRSAKLCSLRVDEDYRGRGLGEELLRATLSDLVGAGCRHVHYTISERVFSECGRFFKPYGFEVCHWQPNLYVRGLDEFSYSAPATVLREVIADAHATVIDSDVVMLSIRPEYATLIEQGRKLVEFRRRFTNRITSGRVFFYVTAPVKQVRMTAVIANVVRDSPTALWQRFGSISGVNRSTFLSYFAGVAEGVALLLAAIMPLRRAVTSSQLYPSGSATRPPMSYSLLKRNSSVLRALANAQ